MGYDRYTVSDDFNCGTYFFCFPLTLKNTFPWPFVPILSNFFEEQWTQNHPQCLSGLSRALFPTTFLEIAVFKLQNALYDNDVPSLPPFLTWQFMFLTLKTFEIMIFKVLVNNCDHNKSSRRMLTNLFSFLSGHKISQNSILCHRRHRCPWGNLVRKRFQSTFVSS